MNALLVPGQTVHTIGVDYIVEYSFFGSQADITSSVYYDPADEEVLKFINPNDYQQSIVDNLSFIFSPSLSTDPTRVWFQDVANITFAEAPIGTDDLDNSGSIDAPDEYTTGHIAIGQLDSSYSNFTAGTTAVALPYNPILFPQNAELKSSDVFFNSNHSFWNGSFSFGSQQFKVLLEEVLHSLGVDVKGLAAEGTYLDNQKYTVTAYEYDAQGNPDYAPGMSYGFGTIAPHNLQILDIAALQAIYGENTSAFTGDTTYNIANMNPGGNNAFLYTIWDGNGTDTIDASATTVGAEIDLRPGRFSSIGKDATGLFSIAKDEDATANDPDPGNVAIAFGAEIENAIGTSYDDRFYTVEGKVNSVDGRGGKDTIDYSHYTGAIDVNLSTNSDSEGNTLLSIEKVILGGAGGSIIGGNGDEELAGGDGSDILSGGAGSNTIIGGQGDDTLSSSDTNATSLSTLSGGVGFDWLEFDGTYDLRLEAGKQISQNSVVEDVEAVRFTNASSNASVIITTLGNTFDVNNLSATPWLNYGDVTDALTIDVSGASWIIEDQLQTVSETITNTSSAALNLTGSNFGDDITLGSNDAKVWLGDDDDDVTITSASGNHILYYKEGHDIVDGAEYLADQDKVILGPDIEDNDLSFSEINQINGIIYGVGNTFQRDFTYDLKLTISASNTLTLEGLTGNTNAGADTLFGTSDDIVTYTSGPRIELWNGSFYDTDRQVNGDGSFIALTGTQYDDALTGTATGNTMRGYDGNDTIDGLAGDDFLYGGNGQDVINGGDGVDRLYGGLNVDTLNGGADNDLLYGNEGDDTLNGGSGADTLYGENGDDTLNGDDGNDALLGQRGDDTLNGGLGVDSLQGGKGNDILNGGVDADTLLGQEGDDTYQFSAGFGSSTGTDVVNEALDSGLDKITFDYSVASSELTYWMDGHDFVLQLGSNTDNQIVVDGAGVNISGVNSGSDFAERLEQVIFSDTTWDLAQGGFTFTDTDIADFYGSTLDDTIYGFANASSSYGLDSGYGDDTVFGGDISSGIYRIRTSDGDDVIDGGSAISSGAYRIHAGSGNDTVNAGLNTGAYYEIFGEGGDDQINVGLTLGSDDEYVLFGGSGDDTYTFNALDGRYEIREEEGEGLDTIHFGSGISASDLYFYGDDGHLEIRFNDSTSNKLELDEANNEDSNDGLLRIWHTYEKITFEDEPNNTIDLTGGLTLVNGIGTEFDDVFTGAQNVTGNAGDDIISAVSEYQYAGVLYMNAYEETFINISSSSQSINGTVVSEGKAIDGQGGTDTLLNINNVFGSRQDDVIWGNDNANTLHGHSGENIIYGFGGYDFLYAANYADQTGNDDTQLYGGTGNDRLFSGAGNDLLDGGSDNDTASFVFGPYPYSGSTGVILNLTQSSQAYGSISIDANSALDLWGSVDTFLNIEKMHLSGKNDISFIGDLAGSIESFSGDDTFVLGQTHETVRIFDTSGTETLLLVDNITPDDVYIWHDSGDNIFIRTDTSSSSVIQLSDGSLSFEQIAFDDGNGVLDSGDLIWDLTAGLTLNDTDDNHTIFGTAFDDVIAGNGGDDNLYGEGGTDTAKFSGLFADYTITDNTTSLTVQDTVGTDGTDTLYDIEILEFSDGTYQSGTFTPTNIVGTAGDDTLNGTANDDVIDGLAGNDTLYAGFGDDTLIGGAGNDTLDGGSGTDVVDYSSSTAGVTVNIHNGTASDGSGGTDTLVSIENIIGSEFNDVLVGNNLLENELWGLGGNDNLQGRGATDIMHGGDGTDTIRGGDDDDILYGGAATDYLYGNADDDYLDGGAGVDALWGHTGADTFGFTAGDAFTGSDNIKDFSLADSDKFDISDLLQGYDPLNDLITDFVEITDNGTHSYLKVDVDGGADNFVQVAQVSFTTGLTDEDNLETNGTLITV